MAPASRSKGPAPASSSICIDPRVEIVDPVTGVCLSFSKSAEVNEAGTELTQKANLTDGRKAKAVIKGNVYIRVTNFDGTVRIYFPLTVVAVPVGKPPN